MTKTIDIKAIIAAFIMVAIVLLVLAMGHHSVSHTKVQQWQADSSWVKSWKF